jgi:hypothetical protein
MSDEATKEAAQLLATWRASLQRQAAQLCSFQNALERLGPMLQGKDADMARWLARDQKRYLTRIDFALQSTPTAKDDVVLLAIARDYQWMAMELKDLSKSFQVASNETEREEFAQSLAESAALTSHLYSEVAARSERISGVLNKPLANTLQTLREMNQIVSGGATNETLRIQIACSQQSLSKRIRRLIRDNHLKEPMAGKQCWSAAEAKIILANPQGRRGHAKKEQL